MDFDAQGLDREINFRGRIRRIRHVLRPRKEPPHDLENRRFALLLIRHLELGEGTIEDARRPFAIVERGGVNIRSVRQLDLIERNVLRTASASLRVPAT